MPNFSDILNLRAFLIDRLTAIKYYHFQLREKEMGTLEDERNLEHVIEDYDKQLQGMFHKIELFLHADVVAYLKNVLTVQGVHNFNQGGQNSRAEIESFQSRWVMILGKSYHTEEENEDLIKAFTKTLLDGFVETKERQRQLESQLSLGQNYHDGESLTSFEGEKLKNAFSKNTRAVSQLRHTTAPDGKDKKSAVQQVSTVSETKAKKQNDMEIDQNLVVQAAVSKVMEYKWVSGVQTPLEYVKSALDINYNNVEPDEQSNIIFTSNTVDPEAAKRAERTSTTASFLSRKRN